MYFVILVVLIYLNVWLENNTKYAFNALKASGNIRSLIILGLVSAGIRGLGVGYILWLIYYCVTTYVLGKLI